MEIHTSAPTTENTTEAPQKMKSELPCDPATALLSIYPQEMSTFDLGRYGADPHVHCSTVYNSQDTEVTERSVDR